MGRLAIFVLGAFVGGAVGFGACAVLTCCAVDEYVSNHGTEPLRADSSATKRETE